MAKEFDIYLRNRLVECDLLVYSIPYRDGISAANRLILEAALNGYLLYMAVETQMGLEVASHVDKMIKLCLEKLSIGVGLGASVDFKSHTTLRPEISSMILDAAAASATVQAFNEVNNGLILATQPLVTQVSSSTGRGNFPLLVDTDVSGTLKHSLLSLQNTTITKAVVEQFNQIDHIDIGSPIAAETELRSLCYQLIFNASAAVEIVALVLGTEIRHSLGNWYSSVALDPRVTGTEVQKFITAQSIVTVLQKAVAKLKKVLYPDAAQAVLHVPSLEITKKRHRRLCEMDSDTLSTYDDMSLDDVDYVIL